MIQKDIYDKICDIFDERFKNEKNKADTKFFRISQCRKTPYHTTIFPPAIPEDRQSSYTFQCNDKAKMCTITGDVYILKEQSSEAIKKLKLVDCNVKEPKPHVTADYIYFVCAAKSYEESIKIAKILRDY